MPTRSVPRLIISSRREVCWACADPMASTSKAARQYKILFIGLSFATQPAGTDAPYRAVAGIRKCTQYGSNPGREGYASLPLLAPFSATLRPDHLASDLFEAPPRIPLTFVDELDCRVRAHRTNNDRGQ